MTPYLIQSSVVDLLIIFTVIQFVLLVLSFIFSFRKDEGKFAKIVYKISLILLFIIIFFTCVVFYESSKRCAPGINCENLQNQLP